MSDGPLSHLNAPNLITVLVAGLGLTGAACAVRGETELALVLGALAVPGDMLDGALARRLGLASPFGARLDSLADLLAFGLLPAVLVLGGPWALAGLPYVLASAWRLAWYEDVGLLQEQRGDRVVSWFRGVPVPFVAASVLVTAAASRLLDLGPAPVGIALLLGPFALLGPVRFRKNGPWYAVMAVALPLSVGAAALAAWGG